MGVSTADFNGDGWIDIYLANDSSPNNSGSINATARSRTRPLRLGQP